MYPKETVLQIIAALRAAGAPSTAIPFMLAQIAHETNGFKSAVFKRDNNASGIMYINKPLRQKNAVRGGKYPANEGKYFYAKFATLKDWAIDYLRIIGKTVAQSTTLLDFATKLRAKKYYTDSIANYSKGLKYHNTLLAKSGIFNNDPAPGGGEIKSPIIIAGLIFLGYLCFS